MYFMKRSFLHACLVLFVFLADAPCAGAEEDGHQKPSGSARKRRSSSSFPRACASSWSLASRRSRVPSRWRSTTDGRLWVVEMRDYPNGPGEGRKARGPHPHPRRQGRRRLLSRRARSSPTICFSRTACLPGRAASIVTAAPHILYLKDTNGNGKADDKEILYEGFATAEPATARQPSDSRPRRLGLLRQRPARRQRHPGTASKDAKPRRSRRHGLPLRSSQPGKYEAISGLGQYGNTFDDWGNRFVCDNRHHLRHIVIENRYLKRNPYLAAPAVVEDISDARRRPAHLRRQDLSDQQELDDVDLHEGRFTAACGVFIYREHDCCRQALSGAAFTCEPTGNLVHMEILKPKGATFSANRQEGAEFLATPDDWFRPVF